MRRGQYEKVKKYKNKRIGLITKKNILFIIIIISVFISIGYSYFSTSLVIVGTVSAISSGDAESGTVDNPYINTDTTYNPSNIQEGATLFTNVPGKPLITVDGDGKVLSFEYTDVGDEGVLYTVGTSVDTGVLAFDASPITIHIVYEMNTGDNTGKYVFSSLVSGSGNKKYSGFVFYCYSASLFYLNAGKNANMNNTGFGSRVTNGFRTSTGTKTYTLDFTFDPTTATNPTANISLTPVTSGSDNYSVQSQYFPQSLDGATITIGGNGVSGDTSKDVASMKVLELRVSRN